MRAHPTHLVVGPQGHGVVSFAVALADSLSRRSHPAPMLRIRDWTVLENAFGRFEHTGVHLNFTDRLYGPSPSEAAGRVSALVRRAERAGTRVTATLHDVPQAIDGGNYRQRVDAYRTVCAALHGRATNSEHERSLLTENDIAEPADVVVVPLPLDLGEVPVTRPVGGRRNVAVLGFVYPGKGHPEVLAAMATAPRDVEFLAIGDCSTGHEGLARDLAESARVSGRRFAITGYVPDGALPSVLHAVSVPVAHHRHVSASASLNSWIAAHRRPITPINRYTVEHDRRHPGTVHLYPNTHRGLVDAIESALEAPGSTWLADGVVSGSPLSETARQYSEALRRWHD